MQVRNTNQRKMILDIMNQNYTHPTADQIYEKARSLDPHISRGTVYRNLAFLAESGSILKITVPDGADHYDCTLENHYHFCCKKCQQMTDVPGSVKVEAGNASQLMAEKGYSVYGHSLIFYGLCPECSRMS